MQCLETLVVTIETWHKKFNGTQCKVVIYNYIFVGFYSVSNLIVIMFNFMFPVFHVGFYL